MGLRKGVVVVYLFFAFFLAAPAYSQDKQELLIDDFEGPILTGMGGTVDAGSDGTSKVEVKGSSQIKYHGAQAIEIAFEAVSGGYMWVSRGYGLDIKGAAAWVVDPKDIDFGKYDAISIWMHGANSNTKIALDLVDSGFEYWRYLIDDNFTGWKEFVIPFAGFFPRGDWQSQKSDKNGELNFPVTAFQFEPRPPGKGTVYFDYVRLQGKGR